MQGQTKQKGTVVRDKKKDKKKRIDKMREGKGDKSTDGIPNMQGLNLKDDSGQQGRSVSGLLSYMYSPSLFVLVIVVTRIGSYQEIYNFAVVTRAGIDEKSYMGDTFSSNNCLRPAIHSLNLGRFSRNH